MPVYMPPRMPTPVAPGEECTSRVAVQLSGYAVPCLPGYVFTIVSIAPDPQGIKGCGSVTVSRDGHTGSVQECHVSPAYVVCNDTCYAYDTDTAVITLLEECRAAHTRIRLHYGDSITGRDWLEEYTVTGTIGRSTGRRKIPLLIQSARSFGGSGLLTAAIVKVTTTRSPRRVLWQHKEYHTGTLTVELGRESADVAAYPWAVLRNGSELARFASKEKAQRWLHNFVA